MMNDDELGILNFKRKEIINYSHKLLKEIKEIRKDFYITQ